MKIFKFCGPVITTCDAGLLQSCVSTVADFPFIDLTYVAESLIAMRNMMKLLIATDFTEVPLSSFHLTDVHCSSPECELQKTVVGIVDLRVRFTHSRLSLSRCF